MRLTRERLRAGLNYDEELAYIHWNLWSATDIAASDQYPTAPPVCPRCNALMQCGAVWTPENHATFPIEDEKRAACTRTLMMGGTRTRDDGTTHAIDIGNVRTGEGKEGLHIPRDVWELIFSFLIFSPPSTRANKRRRRSRRV